MNRRAAHVYTLLCSVLLAGCPTPTSRWAGINPAQLPEEWRTRAERTNYTDTARYDEVVDFCRRLAAASPHARYTTLGVSGEGRALPLVILSSTRSFTPQAAAASGKLLVLVQSCIHAGECDGNDASLALARDILVARTRAALLEHVNLLIMPIFNVDGYERFGPYHRINQNGPREAGWRVTATNLNLNRDYTKADTVEMQQWLRLWVAWQPDFLFDNHVTDGADYQYDLLYSSTLDSLADTHTAFWMRDTLMPQLLARLEADGHRVFPQPDPRDAKDLRKGVVAVGPFPPRFSTGYAAICDRPSILVETHALKPYGQRVRATYDVMVHTLEMLNREPARLRAAIRAADEQTAARRGAEADGRLVLRQKRTEDGRPVVFHAIEQRVRQSEITGSEVVEYAGRPVDVVTTLYDQLRTEASVVPPVAYLIPPQWTDVIERLKLHGIDYFALREPKRLEVQVYHFENVKFAPRPQEGRQRPTYETIVASQTRDFVAGTVVVPMNQRRAKVAAHLLEPEAPDSLVAWGFFNAIFEQKEYAETYVLEPLARRMLAEDAALKAAFEERLRTDAEFAKSPGARLDYFYQRSPYWDAALNLYPVARLMDEDAWVRLQAGARR